MFKNKKTLTFTKKFAGTPIPDAKLDDAGAPAHATKVIKKPTKKTVKGKKTSKQLSASAAKALVKAR